MKGAVKVWLISRAFSSFGKPISMLESEMLWDGGQGKKKKKKNGQDLSIAALLFVGRNRREEIVKNSPALGETKI